MAYIDKYGVEYSDGRKTLVRCPQDFLGEYIIPDGVTSIGNNAFRMCDSLTSIVIPNSVTSIGEKAFWCCESLKSLMIPNSVTNIGEGAFHCCRGLSSVIIPNSVTNIGEEAFVDCSGLTAIEIPDSVTSIGKAAFLGCSGLTSLNIPNSVTSIGESAFYYCKGLKSVFIGNSVTNIGDNAFDKCECLTSIEVSFDNPNYCSIDGVLFNKDRTILIRYPSGKQGLYMIPNGVKEISIRSFDSSDGLTSVTIPKSVTSIGEKAFWCCESLKSLMIPNSVTNIGDGAFECCTSLTSLMIPNSVTSIGKSAFSTCSGLKSLMIPDSVTSIGESAFEYCTSLTSLNIPNSVTSIGERAFSHCLRLTSVMIPNSVTSIREEAFDSCFDLTSVTISDSVTSIGERAFSHCRRLTSVMIPNSVTNIRKEAFDSCFDLTSVTIPDSVTEIGAYAFFECRSLKTIIIPNSVTNIGEGVFSACSSLKYIDIAPNNPNYCSIDGVLFSKDKTILIKYPCGKQGAYTIPNSVINIEERAFFYCSDLTSLTIPDSVTTVRGEYALRGCSSLSGIIVPSGQEERFCQMDSLKKYADIIHKTAEKRRFLIEEQEQQRLMEQQMQEMLQGSFLFFDTETTGTPRNYRAPVSDSDNWPRLVQLAWVMADSEGNILKNKSVIIKPNGFSIPSDASVVHGITTERALREGKALADVLAEFNTDLSFATQVVGHNIDFDQRIVGAELYRLNMDYDALMNKPSVCTMKSSTNFCAIPNPNPYFGGYKWPSLSELYRKLFGRDFSGAHDALADITATKDCFFELKRRGIIKD